MAATSTTATTVNQYRAAMPAGTDTTIRLKGRSAGLFVTVIEHTTDGVFVGVHPHLLFVRYSELAELELGAAIHGALEGFCPACGEDRSEVAECVR